jgi:hypothetical protein
MKLSEFAPGRRVYIILPPNTKLYGRTCFIRDMHREEPGVCLDNGAVIRMTETNAPYIHLEKGN